MGRGDLKGSVTVNLEGNLESRSKTYTKAMERMAKRGEKHIGLLNRASGVAGRGLDRLGNRYVGLLTGATVAYAVKGVANLEERYTRLGINADISDKKIQGLKNTIFDTAQDADISVDPGEILSAVESIVEKTGDLKFAEDNIRNIGLAMQATGASGADIGEMLAEFQKQGVLASSEVLKAIDTMNLQGKAGAFTLAEMARLGPRVVTAYAAAGRSGVGALREMGAALQVIRMGTGSSEMAATAFEAVMRTLADPKKIKLLKELGGVSVFDPEALKQGKEQLRPINELMVDIIKASGGKQTNLAAIFDAEAMRAFNSAAAEFQRTGSVESLERFMSVMGDGQTTLNDAQRGASTFNASMGQLRTSLQEFAEDNLSKPVSDVAGWIKSLDKDTVSLALNTATWAAGIGAAWVVGRKMFGMYKGMSGMVKGAAGALTKGAAGGIASSLKPIPVYVVNGPGGLGGKGGFGKTKALGKWQILKSAPNLKSIGALGAGAMGTAGLAVGAAGAVGYGAGSLINKAIEGTSFADALGKALVTAMAAAGNDEAQASLDRMQKYEASLKVTVDDERVRVTRVTADPGFDMDVDNGMTMP